MVLFVCRESDLSSRGSWQVTHELVLQWLSAVATPYWWSETQIANALARYVTTYTTLQVTNSLTTNLQFRHSSNL